MKNAIAGFALAIAAALGGNFIGNALDNAIDAPRKRFDAAANAQIEQFRRIGQFRREEEIRRLERQLARIMAGPTTGH